MAASKNNKITWITCPDCGGKIGIVISVGKTEATVVHHETEEWPLATDASGMLQAAGIDVNLLNIEEDEATISVSPKKFLGDMWGPINESIRTIGGQWVRDGRNSRWEIAKQSS